jgi:hypothetical protein
MTYREIRDRADRLRDIPLETVLLAIGAVRDREDKAKWHTTNGVLSVNGAKFMDWVRGVGGGGAIDLVMDVGGLSFKDALEWLWQRFPRFDGLPPCVTPPRRAELRLPRACLGTLSRALSYLEHGRGLPAALIESLVGAGTLYADARGNVVFLLLGKKNTPVGAELRGTTQARWRGMAPGSRKDLGYFSIPRAGPIVLCESAIDAMSCRVLNPDHLCISTAGARPNPGWLAELIDSGHEISCGFDADPAGDAMAASMIALHPTVRRLRPPGKDWNDVLRARSRSAGPYQVDGLTEGRRFP